MRSIVEILLTTNNYIKIILLIVVLYETQSDKVPAHQWQLLMIFLDPRGNKRTKDIANTIFTTKMSLPVFARHISL